MLISFYSPDLQLDKGSFLDMPQRRSHTKSRAGCHRCKQRRIKCDETGPPCSTCKARQAECKYSSNIFRASSWNEQYDNGNTLSRRGGPSSTVPEASSQQTQFQDTQKSPSSHLPSEKRIRELQLMHHWTLETCHSFSTLSSEVFQTFVVEQALHFTFLMEALLALTSLHMASDLPLDNSNRARFMRDAVQYQSKAMPAFRMELKNVSKTNCHALFACAVMMMASTFVIPSLEVSSQNKVENRAQRCTDMKSLFYLLKGIHSIIDQERPSLDEGPFKFIIQPWSGADSAFFSKGDRMIPPALRRLCCDLDVESKNLYNNAIDRLEHCAMAEGMVIPWIMMAGESFVERVEGEEPLALLIYICWGALMGRLEMWWARIAGETIVHNLADYIDAGNEDWWIVMRWAKEITQKAS